MASITLGGKPVKTSGELPTIGSQAPNFKLATVDLSSSSLDDYKGSNLILNIFPSVNTGVCAQSVRTFNEKAASLPNTKVLCISRDLPFTQKNFCAAEGIENVIMLSDFRYHDFGKDYGLVYEDGIFEGLLSRAVVIIDSSGNIVYTQQVPETGEEPNYSQALAVL